MEQKDQSISRAAFLRGGFRDHQRTFIVSISDVCLSAKGIVCRTCEEQCDEDAISFKLAIGGVATALVNTSDCTGCGACIAPCPVDAIEFMEIDA